MPKWYRTAYKNVEANNIPDWTKDLIIGEVNLRTATPEGNIQSAVKVLDHYAEMGVNGIWITPVYDGGAYGNGYGNLGINTIDPTLTGTDDYESGWEILKSFVDQAHERNIRVILDVVFRGVEKDSPLYSEHPNWFEKDTQYGNYRYKWQDSSVYEEIASWYVEQVLNIVKKTGCDGLRYDMMPATTAGTDVEKRIVDTLHNNGCFMFIMSEAANKRSGYYATETVSILEALSYSYYSDPYDLFLGKYDIVDFIKNGSDKLNGSGNYKYYTYSLTNHDFKKTLINGNRLSVGYQAIMTPFIPVMYLGEEWNNPHISSLSGDSALYYNKIDWSVIDMWSNRAFYEDIKAMIRIRRMYSDIFNINAESFKNSNITKLNSNSDIPVYARYAGKRAAVIVPNNTENITNVSITISLDNIGLNQYNDFRVIDAETDALIASGSAEDIKNLNIAVQAMDQRVLIITAE